MAEQSQLRDGLETTSGYRSLDCNHASHMCGNNMRAIQSCKSAAASQKAVTRRSHTRIFVGCCRWDETARPRSATSGCQSVMSGAAEARHVATGGWAFCHPAVTVACEDRAFACRSTAGCEHEAKRRDRFQPAPAGETRCSNRSFGGREHPIFSSCVGRRRRRELLDSRLFLGAWQHLRCNRDGRSRRSTIIPACLPEPRSPAHGSSR